MLSLIVVELSRSLVVHDQEEGVVIFSRSAIWGDTLHEAHIADAAKDLEVHHEGQGDVLAQKMQNKKPEGPRKDDENYHLPSNWVILL